MRNKIIAVNALIVIVVGLLAFLLVRAALSSAVTNQDRVIGDARRDVAGAAARLEVDSLSAERWLSGKAADRGTLQALAPANTEDARGNNATQRADELAKEMPSALLVALLDDQGKILGRNNSNGERGVDLGAKLPGLKASLISGRSGSDILLDKDDKLLASYVAVRDAQGKVLGGIVISRPVASMLSRLSDPNRPLALAVPVGDDMQFPVGAPNITKDIVKSTVKDPMLVKDQNIVVASAPLIEIGLDGKHPILVQSSPAALLQDTSAITMPILGAMGLGFLGVLIGGWLLGNYITRPINTLEEGLLAILNGQADRRFELEHAELGGLAFRIDQLLNQLMGVEEDTTDAEGRASKPPSAAHFTDAMSVDDKRMEGEGTLDPESVSRLANEPANAYFARIYREYIAAKKVLGEATDHITEQAFTTRIQGMEKDASAKYGRPVRYQVQARSKEVVLLAIPLP